MMKNLETITDKKMFGSGDGSLELWLRVGVKLHADTILDKEALMRLWQVLSEGGTAQQVAALHTLRQFILPPGQPSEV